MQERNRTRQSGSPDQTRSRELITLVMRLAAFVATLIPLAALALPWVTLDGTEEAVSGVGAVALLAPPMSEYLYTVSSLQATLLTVGPILVALLAIITGYNYRRRRSIYWAPPAMLIVSGAIAFGTADLITTTEPGLAIVMAVSVLLILHQAAIRIQVVLRRKMKMPEVYRTLAVVTGMGHYRWSEQ